MSAADFERLQAMAAAAPKGKTPREELEAAKKASRKELDRLPNVSENAGAQRVHKAILAIDTEQEWLDLRGRKPGGATALLLGGPGDVGFARSRAWGPTDLFPEPVDTQSQELFRIVATMTASAYARFQGLAKQPGDLDELKRAARITLAGLSDEPKDADARRANLALLAVNSEAQCVALRDKGVPLTEAQLTANRSHAGSLSWLALGEIVAFFGVLLVGFAYLWKRGDLAWVRSLQAERQLSTPLPGPAPAPAPQALVGAGEAVAQH
jgi:hypothetical protein